MKSRTFRIQTILSCELWLEFYKTANYFNNRIFKKFLNRLISIKILIDERSKLFHIQSYDCRIYSLKHIIVRKTKMKFRAMINHLIKYDSINVFRVWISSKMRIIRTCDVLFDFYSFYDLCVSDLKHFLSIKMKNVIQILKMFETMFDDVLIEQKDDDSKELIFETIFKKIDELMIDLIDLQINLKNFVFNEISQMIIFEMISNREIHFLTTFAILKFDHIATLSKVIDQIEIVIQKISRKIQISSKAFQHSSIDSISDVQIRFESMINQARFDLFNSFNQFNSNWRTKAKSSIDFVTMNTRSRTRKQMYATTLIIVNQLNFYFATFSIELQRLNIISVVFKLHKNDLSTKLRYWRQMLNHCFFQEFQSIAVKKMTELKKRDIFLLIEKRSNQARISLIWVFKYKFDTNEYVEKFKARLCFRDDLQMIH
jgi:hypothetical protein